MRTRISTIFGVIVPLFLALATPAAAQYRVTTGPLTVSTPDDAIVSQFCHYPSSIAIRPDGAAAWEAAGAGQLASFDPNHCTQDFNELFTGGSAAFVQFAPDGRRLYVVDAVNDRLLVVDTIARRVTGTVEIFPQHLEDDGEGHAIVAFTFPAGLSVSPDGTKIFVPGNQVRELSIIDATQMLGGNIVPIADYNNPEAIALKWSADPDARRLYLGGSSGYISVYNPSTFELLTSFLVGELYQDSVTHMVLSPDTSRLYMSTASGKLLVLDTATNAIVRESALLQPATDIALTPDGRHLYIPGVNSLGTLSSKLFHVDALTGALLNTIVVAGRFDQGMAAGVGRLTFASMTASAALTSGVDAPFSMSGTFSLASGNAIDPLHEDVTVAVSTYAFWAQAGTFVEAAPGVFRRAGYNDPFTGRPQPDIELRSTGGNSYAFTVTGQGVDTTGEALPLQALVVVGDDGGMATMDLNAGLQQTISSLQSELSASQGLVATLQSQNDALVQANANLNAQIDPLTQQVAALTAQVQPLTDQVQALAAEVQPLRDQVGTLTTLNESLATENVRLTTANAQLTTANQDLAGRNAQVSVRNARLASQLDTARQTIDTLRARVAELRDTIDQKNGRIEDLRAKLDAANATIETLRARIAALKNK